MTSERKRALEQTGATEDGTARADQDRVEGEGDAPVERLCDENRRLTQDLARLTGEWESLKAQFDTLASQHRGLWEEAQIIRAERDRFMAEAMRLAKEWQAVAEQLDAARKGAMGKAAGISEEHARVTAERDSLLVEARRLSNEWAALSDELRACKRRVDIAEGDKLLLGARLRELEAGLERARVAQDGLSRQPLFRVMCRTGLLKGLEVPNGPGR